MIIHSTSIELGAWGTAYRLLWAICLNFDKFILDNFIVIGHLTGFKEDPSWWWTQPHITLFPSSSTPKEKSSVIICGPNQPGKSTLLYQLQAETEAQRCHAIYIDTEVAIKHPDKFYQGSFVLCARQETFSGQVWSCWNSMRDWREWDGKGSSQVLQNTVHSCWNVHRSRSSRGYFPTHCRSFITRYFFVDLC